MSAELYDLIQAHRAAIAKADRSTWENKLTDAVREVKAAGGTVDDGLSLLHAADGWTVRSGRKPEMVKRVGAFWEA